MCVLCFRRVQIQTLPDLRAELCARYTLVVSTPAAAAAEASSDTNSPLKPGYTLFSSRLQLFNLRSKMQSRNRVSIFLLLSVPSAQGGIKYDIEIQESCAMPLSTIPMEVDKTFHTATPSRPPYMSQAQHQSQSCPSSCPSSASQTPSAHPHMRTWNRSRS
jgi:hypothetical protein